MIWKKVTKLFKKEHIESFYERYENRISLLALVLGFILDNLFLIRVDAFSDQLVLTLYILISGLCIFLISRNESEGRDDLKNARIHFWLSLGLQFALGGLFSAYVIFYTRSGSFESSWPFLVLLLVYFLGNEFLKKYYLRLSFRLSVYFFALLSYFVIMVPTLLKSISGYVFILSTVISIIVFGAFVSLVGRFRKDLKTNRLRRVLYYSIILVVVNLFYMTNIIPPLPLLIKDEGVYHDLIPIGNGGYIGSEEKQSLFDRFFGREIFHRYESEPVYVFTAVYSPIDLNTTIVHNWQRYDESEKKWVTESKVNVPIRGGRQDGYRLYSLKRIVREGDWRVNIETVNGRLLGRVKFRIENVSTAPLLHIITK